MNINRYIECLHNGDNQEIRYANRSSLLRKTADEYEIEGTTDKEGEPFKVGRKVMKETFKTKYTLHNATALHLAVANDNSEIVRWLIDEEGVDVNITCNVRYSTNKVTSCPSGKLVSAAI